LLKIPRKSLALSNAQPKPLEIFQEKAILFGFSFSDMKNKKPNHYSHLKNTGWVSFSRQAAAQR